MKVISLTKTDSIAQLPLYISESVPTTPAQQVTINHLSEANNRWPRNIQLTTDFVLIKRAGCPTTGIHVDDLIRLCAQAEPRISWPPLFIKNILTNGDIVTIESTFRTNNPELSEEANKISYQWQSGDNRGVIWTDIEDGDIFSGTKTNRLSIDNKPGNPNLILRCVATNAAGSRASTTITSASPQIPPAAKAVPANPIVPAPVASNAT